MQALGSYRAGKLLFLGQGTGLGSAMIVNGIVEPMELAHLPYEKGGNTLPRSPEGGHRRGRKKSLTMQPETAVASNDLEIASAVELAIRKRTWDRVSHLRVEWTGEAVVVHGSTQTYYLKQLALEAARNALGGRRPLIIDIAAT